MESPTMLSWVRPAQDARAAGTASGPHLRARPVKGDQRPFGSRNERHGEASTDARY